MSSDILSPQTLRYLSDAHVLAAVRAVMTIRGVNQLRVVQSSGGVVVVKRESTHE